MANQMRSFTSGYLKIGFLVVLMGISHIVNAAPSTPFDSLQLPDAWTRTPSVEPVLFSAALRDLKTGDLASSSITVQSEKLSKDTIDLRDRLKDRKLGDGDRFGKWIVKSVEPRSECYGLRLESPSEQMRQFWCFSSDQAYTLTELGPKMISSDFRERILNVMKHMSNNREKRSE